jgi:S-formylglutathione hydrolase FrmB
VIEEAGIAVDWSRKSVFGHSMGGHGALTLYLQTLGSASAFRSASGFAPITNPVNVSYLFPVYRRFDYNTRYDRLLGDKRLSTGT